MTKREELQELLNKAAFPETPEERDAAENTVFALLEAAWEEGAEAYATRRARDESLPLTNPYTALENNK